VTRKKFHDFPGEVSLDPAISPQSRADADHRAGMEDEDISIPVDELVQSDTREIDGLTLEAADNG
jgi:hypothetical protein